LPIIALILSYFVIISCLCVHDIQAGEVFGWKTAKGAPPEGSEDVENPSQRETGRPAEERDSPREAFSFANFQKWGLQ
jgi:hypothetical protein